MRPLVDDPRAPLHLASVDPVMARLVDSVGPVVMRPGGDNPFQALARSIIFQQLSGKAAGTIYGRFVALFEVAEDAFPAPQAVLVRPDDHLRSAGLSRQKTASLRSLAEHFASGELGSEAFEHWDDDDIINHLARVRGIGRWTAEMFLMFFLRRPDVLPVNDVGINRAIERLYGLAGPPLPVDVLRIGAPWRPWASAACWYLWRSSEL